MSPLDLKDLGRRLKPSRTKRPAAGGGDAAPGERTAAPKIVSDLYADLRDSHMLLPAALLLVAIAAIPLLLGGGSEPVPPAATPPVDEATATRVAPAVFAKQTGIRDYDERLDTLRETNPFKQQFVRPEEDAQVAVDGPEASSDPSISITGGGESSPTASPEPDAGVSAPTTSEPQPAPAAPTGVEPSSTTTTTTTTRLVTYRVDVSVGRAGELKDRDDVRRLEPLPSKRQPVVVFLGVSENAKRASFLLARDVVDTSGDGVCLKAERGPYEVVTMKRGDSRFFTFGKREQRFRLKLRDIVPHEKSPDGD